MEIVRGRRRQALVIIGGGAVDGWGKRGAPRGCAAPGAERRGNERGFFPHRRSVIHRIGGGFPQWWGKGLTVRAVARRQFVL